MPEINIQRGNRPSVLEISVSNSSDPMGNVISLIEKFYKEKLKLKAKFRESESSDVLWITRDTEYEKELYLGRIIIKESFIYNNYKIEFDISKKELNKNYNSDETAKKFLEYYESYSKPS